MNFTSNYYPCDNAELVCAYALQALPVGMVAEVERHLATCVQCQRELKSLHPVTDFFVAWPAEVLRPDATLQQRLAERIAAGTGNESVLPPSRQGSEPEWEVVTSGVSCKILANDADLERIAMLVRLVPGGQYPAHTHAGVEELHLLGGELWIDDRLLYPGDYHRAERGTVDKHVWSETGCTCVLITSVKDVLS